MGALGEALREAARLVLQGDTALHEIVILSLQVSGLALLISTVLGVPVGVFLGLKRFIGRRALLALVYTGMGFPPVVIGLFVYLFLSRSGPLGTLGWLFTPAAMVVAQAIIAFPLVAGFTTAAIMGVDPNLQPQLLTLGATRLQATWALVREARVGIVVALIAGFGGIISEVGAVMLVGGNIEGYTRVLTTAIVLETRQGDFSLALALGIILMGLSLIINVAMLWLQGNDG